VDSFRFSVQLGGDKRSRKDFAQKLTVVDQRNLEIGTWIFFACNHCQHLTREFGILHVQRHCKVLLENSIVIIMASDLHRYGAKNIKT